MGRFGKCAVFKFLDPFSVDFLVLCWCSEKRRAHPNKLILDKMSTTSKRIFMVFLPGVREQLEKITPQNFGHFSKNAWWLLKFETSFAGTIHFIFSIICEKFCSLIVLGQIHLKLRPVQMFANFKINLEIFVEKCQTTRI